jgi:hypothetical protein
VKFSSKAIDGAGELYYSLLPCVYIVENDPMTASHQPVDGTAVENDGVTGWAV